MFLRFDFSKHPYAYGRDRVPNKRERESEKSVCACVKETWTTTNKSREKSCVSYANISHMHLRQRRQGEEIVCGCLEPREQDP